MKNWYEVVIRGFDGKGNLVFRFEDTVYASEAKAIGCAFRRAGPMPATATRTTVNVY